MSDYESEESQGYVELRVPASLKRKLPSEAALHILGVNESNRADFDLPQPQPPPQPPVVVGDDSNAKAPRSGAGKPRYADSGDDSAYFAVKGLTMRAPNPLYESAKARRRDLYDEYRLRQLNVRQAKSWISVVEQIRPLAAFPDPTLYRNLEVSDAEIRNVLAAGTLPRKPPQIADERNARYRALFAAERGHVRDGAVARITLSRVNQLNALVDALPVEAPQVERENLQTAAANAEQDATMLINGVLEEFAEVARHADFSEMTLSVEELRGVFIVHMGHKLQELQRADEVLPFYAEEVFSTQQRIDYARETVLSNVIPAFRGWLSAFLEDEAGVMAATAPSAPVVLNRYVNSLLSGSPESPAPLRPEVASRSHTIKADAQISERYGRSVLLAIVVEAVLNEFGEREPSLSDLDVSELRRERAARLLAQDPSDAARETQRVRVLYEADSIRAASEARLARVEHELRALRATVDVPQAADRDVNSPLGFVLHAHVALRQNAPAPQPDITAENVAYVFRWYWRSPSGNELNVRTSNIRPQEEPTDAYKVVKGGPLDGANAYGGGAHVGEYRVEVDRVVGGVQSAQLHSNVASLRVHTECVRCGVRFYLGDGVARSFGECHWKSKPVNRALTRFRASDSFLPIRERLHIRGVGSGSNLDFIPSLDDSIVGADGYIVDNDRSLQDLGDMGPEYLRKTYFTYEAVLQNMARRMRTKYVEMYGYDAARAAFDILYAARNAGGRNEPLIGAVFAALDPPGPEIIARAENALLGVTTRLEDATALLQNLPVDASQSQRNAAAAGYEAAEAEASAADRFRREVLVPLAEADARAASNDYVDGFTSPPVIAMQDTAGRARSLRELPLYGVLGVILDHVAGGEPLRAIATSSEMRFWHTLDARSNEFMRLYRAVALAGGGVSDHKRRRLLERQGIKSVTYSRVNASLLDDTSQHLIDTASGRFKRMHDDRAPTFLFFEPSTHYVRIKGPLNSREIWASALAHADTELAAMTQSQVLASVVWNERHLFASTQSLDPGDFFHDAAGEKRLVSRIESSRARSQMYGDAAQRVLDVAYDDREAAINELAVAEGVGAPFGVPMRLWFEMESTANTAGVAAAAVFASQIRRVGGIDEALKIADWVGVHSERDDQPTIYEIVFLPQPPAAGGGDLAVITKRGSERLRSGYDFRGLHMVIARLVRAFNNTPAADIDARLAIRERLSRLVIAFNALAQWAPKLGSITYMTGKACVMGARDIEDNLPELVFKA